ncbi:Uncharacterized conserved protein [Anaerobiospirillum thomasii]|uniref:Uncharacterized conserved protein n=1 Tax=Anaerobiospirillum thomasii TaxID=179995 RepID=A0A2X0WRP0_9GAMM|nr:NirD/YgiW/YdeI family stress tolerance protein [Anaerobiospirillum thomasii]SPT68101.1 Uncharacterized conserved protein [Anaerobiospirillum thomasii]SPT70561.1 Uncharacterized conserved protein [Anaerobiospirillum thomasii]
MSKAIIITTLSALALSSTVAFAAPQGFNNSSAPQGFTQAPQANAPQGFANSAAQLPAIASVSDAINKGLDEQHVTLRGRITNFIGDDKYEFQDETGTIKIELDDDQNWSHIQKDQLIEITGELDKHLQYVKIEVYRATPISK